MTARELIASSLRLIGVLSSGETPSADEASDALTTLNQMLEEWSTQRLLINAIVEESFPLQVGVGQYSMGPSATFDTTRPQKIVKARLRQGSNDFPVDIITVDRFATIITKGTDSSIPIWLYPEGTFPNETLNLWPVPSEANTLLLYSWKELTAFATLDTAVSLPPGYDKALRFSLATDLAIEYGKEIGPALAGKTAIAVGNIKRMNNKPEKMSIDEALLSRGAVFDWRTGDY